MDGSQCKTKENIHNNKRKLKITSQITHNYIVKLKYTCDMSLDICYNNLYPVILKSLFNESGINLPASWLRIFSNQNLK